VHALDDGLDDFAFVLAQALQFGMGEILGGFAR
jgi:hypothetical protein